MEELNTTQDVHVIADNGWDALTVTDMGESFALSQVAEDGSLHNVILSIVQIEALMEYLEGALDD